MAGGPVPVILGTPNDVIWSTNGVVNTGRITRARQRNPTKKDISEDNNGIPSGAVMVSDLVDMDYEMECQASVNLPSNFSTVTFANIANCIVEECEQTWTRGARQRASLKLFNFPTY
jgi:hypothetical protein